jgi:hypothetical protein
MLRTLEKHVFMKRKGQMSLHGESSDCAHFGPTIDMWQDIRSHHQIFPYVVRYIFKIFYLCDQEYFL